MTARFTKGPWKEGDYILWPAHGGNAQFPIHAPKRGRIALALTRQADARLIAAAPELLEALRGLLAEAGGASKPLHSQSEWSIKARAALAKATGESTHD